MVSQAGVTVPGVVRCAGFMVARAATRCCVDHAKGPMAAQEGLAAPSCFESFII